MNNEDIELFLGLIIGDDYIKNDLLRYIKYDNISNIINCIKNSERNYEMMNFISSLLYYLCVYDKNLNHKYYKLRTVINNVKINKENFINLDFFGINNLVLIKYSGENINIKTEYLIGKVLNNLRKDIPNFSYIFSIDTFDKSWVYNKLIKKTILYPFTEIFDNNKDNMYYMEKVEGDIIGELYSPKELDIQDFFNIILQLYLALSYAYYKYEFIHNNLDIYNNISVQKKNSKLKYKYWYNNNPIFLETDILVSITDYNNSYAKYKDRDIINKPDINLLQLVIKIVKQFIYISNSKTIEFITLFTNILSSDKKNFNIEYNNELINFRKKIINNKLIINYDDIIYLLIELGILFNLNNIPLLEQDGSILFSSNILTNNCFNEINNFMNRSVIQFNDCLGFYDFFVNSKTKLIYNKTNLSLTFNKNDKSYNIDFNYLEYIIKDIELLEFYIKDFTIFLIQLHNIDSNFINNQNNILIVNNYIIKREIYKFIRFFIIDNYFIVKYIIENILKVMNIFKSKIDTEIYNNLITKMEIIVDNFDKIRII